MTPPVTIPEEVLAKARTALDDARTEREERFAVEAIARAILSAQEEQREKDAKIADRYGIPVISEKGERVATTGPAAAAAAAIREGR